LLSDDEEKKEYLFPDLINDVPCFEPDLSQCDLSEVELIQELDAKALAMKPKAPGVSKIPPHRIDTGSSPPIRKRPYTLSRLETKEADRQIADLLKAGLISPSQSPYAAPILFVKKKDGTLRLCIDYRGLNAVTVADVYPLPLIRDVLSRLGGARYLSVLDLASGYWQIFPIAEADRHKAAFIYSGGLYEPNVMMFGLRNAPSTFQRAMDVTLSGLIGNICFAYIDDVIVFSKTFKDHLADLRAVIGRLMDAGLRLRFDKCTFCCCREVPAVPGSYHLEGWYVSRSGESCCYRCVETSS
jgi:hypothetical protein